jgi:hypothetical protein
MANVNLNTLGIVLNIVGVILVYYNSPLNESVVDGGRADTDFDIERRLAILRNRWARAGVIIVLLGSCVQILSNYL